LKILYISRTSEGKLWRKWRYLSQSYEDGVTKKEYHLHNGDGLEKARIRVCWGAV